MLEEVLDTQAFRTHDLPTQQRAALMERQDTKYLVSYAQLGVILPALSLSHSLLAQQGDRLFGYESLYFDTPDLHCYHAHHNGKLNRYKIRLRRYMDRHYLDTQTAFIEIKLRSNRARTIKQRTPCDSDTQDIGAAQAFIEAQLPSHLHVLKPSLWVRYQRLTLMHLQRCERLTIDTALQFLPAGSQSAQALAQLAVLELKVPPGAQGSATQSLLRSHGLRPLSFSKYCIGLALCAEAGLLSHEPFRRAPKLNRFLPVLKRLGPARKTLPSDTPVRCFPLSRQGFLANRSAAASG